MAQHDTHTPHITATLPTTCPRYTHHAHASPTSCPPMYTLCSVAESEEAINYAFMSPQSGRLFYYRKCVKMAVRYDFTLFNDIFNSLSGELHI